MSEKVDFMKIMHEAYAQDEMTPDEYMVEKLHNVFPYSLTFKKYPKRGEE